MTTQSTDESLGLSIDSDIGHWGSVPFVASKMQTLATDIEKAVRDIGTLRSRLVEAESIAQRSAPSPMSDQG
jgi:hypothetical protein